MLSVDVSWSHGNFLCCAVVGASMDDVEEAGHAAEDCVRFAFPKGFLFVTPCTVRLMERG